MDKKIKLRNEINYTIDGNLEGKTTNKINEKIDLEKSEGSKYMSGQLCQLVDLWELTNEKKGWFKLQTPFGLASVTNKKDKEIKFGNLTYREIAQNITDNEEDTEENIEIIYDYLNTPSDENIKSIEDFNKTVEVKPEYLELKSRKEFETLSAILMLSDPYRFKDGGGLSRGAIRKAYDDIKKKDQDVLIKIFGDGGEIFKKNREADYPPSQYDGNSNSELRKTAKSYYLGGVKRTLNALEFARGKKEGKKDYDEKNTKETKESIKDTLKRLSKFDKYVSPNKSGNNRKTKITELPRFTRSDLKKALNGSIEKNGAKTRRQKRNEKENAKNYQNQKDTFYSLLSRAISKSSSKSPKNKIERSRNKNEKNRKTKQDQKITRNIRKIDVNKI